MDSRSKLQAIAQDCGFLTSWESEGELSFSFGKTTFPFWIVTKATGDDELVIAGRVRTYGLAGCRTDLHDWVGALWTACLRVLQVSSVWVMDEGGFVSANEIYGRYLLLTQPSNSSYSLRHDSEAVRRVFAASAIAAQAVAQVWCSAKISHDDDWQYGGDGVRFSRRKGRGGRATISGTRSNCVNYYRDCTSDVSISDFRNCSAWSDIWNFFDTPLDATVGESDAAHLLCSGRIRNVIWKKAEASLRKLAERKLGAKPSAVRFVPCDSHLFALAPSGLCCKRIESGGQAYAQQFELLRRRHAKNAALLNQDIQFQWASHINPARFEELLHRVLAENPEVIRVKQVGHSNEPDGGRDFIIDVRRSFLKRDAAPEDEKQSEVVPILVQCKTSKRNVGKGAVADIRDTVEKHQAFGFLLVAYPGVARSLVEYVEEVRTRKLFWIEHWTRTDLEAQLRAVPDAANSFEDVVRVTNPRRTR